MESDWNFYPCFVDGKPASIFVNLGLAQLAPISKLSHMAYVRIHMQQPRPDGLSSKDEFETLVSIEDSLLPQLEKQGEVLYVGRNTSNGCRDFYFYTTPLNDWMARVKLAMQAHPEYAHETGTRADTKWSTYFEFLYPDKRDMQLIGNQRLCFALENDGDDPTKIRDIDHWSYFPSASSRERFLTSAVAQGFLIRALSETPNSERPFCAQLYRQDAPAQIDVPVLTLFDAASEAGGEYDGWETPIIGRDHT